MTSGILRFTVTRYITLGILMACPYDDLAPLMA